MHGAAAPEIVRCAGDEPHRADALPAGRIEAGGDLRRLARGVVALGDALDRLGEGRVRGDVGDARTVEEDGAPVPETRHVLLPPAHAETLAHVVGGSKGRPAVEWRVA
jgi:hypothetical protein